VLTVHPVDAPSRKVAIARLIRYDRNPSDADVAVTVLDAWEGVGIATLLLEELMRLRPTGVTRLVTEVADDNPAATAMLARLGETTVTPTAQGSLEVVVSLPDRSDGRVSTPSSS
jgi:RimJ/RimL family protein N-acetyltransferase